MYRSAQGPVSLGGFPSQFKFDGISFYYHLNSNAVIATQIFTWHDSHFVVACATICCDLMAKNGIAGRLSFHRIWIVSKKSLVKRAPAQFLGQLSGDWHLISSMLPYVTQSKEMLFRKPIFIDDLDRTPIQNGVLSTAWHLMAFRIFIDIFHFFLNIFRNIYGIMSIYPIRFCFLNARKCVQYIHNLIYVHIYIYICVFVCVCIYVC